MARLEYSELPDNIKQEYSSKNIHKIVKPSQTSLTIHTKSHEKHNWKKSGNKWYRTNQEEEDVRNI